MGSTHLAYNSMAVCASPTLYDVCALPSRSARSSGQLVCTEEAVSGHHQAKESRARKGIALTLGIGTASGSRVEGISSAEEASRAGSNSMFFHSKYGSSSGLKEQK